MGYRNSSRRASRSGIWRVVATACTGRGLRGTLLVLGVLGGCRAGELLRPPVATGGGDDNDAPDGPLPGRLLVAVSGDGQADSVGTTLAMPFVVRVENASGAPVSGVAVVWRVVSGGGSVEGNAGVTDATGESRTLLTLGTQPGPSVVEASATSAAGGPARFTVVAHPGAPSAARIEVDASQTVVNEPIRPAMRVVLEDRFGNRTPQAVGVATIALVEGTGTPLASAYGTLSAPIAEGRAEFGNVRVNLPGSGYRLRIAAQGLTAMTRTFDVALLPSP